MTDKTNAIDGVDTNKIDTNKIDKIDTNKIDMVYDKSNIESDDDADDTKFGKLLLRLENITKDDIDEYLEKSGREFPIGCGELTLDNCDRCPECKNEGYYTCEDCNSDIKYCSNHASKCHSCGTYSCYKHMRDGLCYDGGAHDRCYENNIENNVEDATDE